MKRDDTSFLGIMLALGCGVGLISLLGCESSKIDPSIGAAHANTSKPVDSAQTPSKLYGAVKETMTVENYTYVLLDNGKETYWAAGPTTQVNVGDMVAVENPMEMTNFQSKSLNKTFERIYFVATISTDSAHESPAPEAHTNTEPHPHSRLGSSAITVEAGSIDKAVNGVTISELYARKDQLKSNVIRLRGKVTKFTAAVMGKNWVHVQDGTTEKDLTVTTNDTVGIGDVVLINGSLVTDRDFGFGYHYDLLIEDAKLTVEPNSQ